MVQNGYLAKRICRDKWNKDTSNVVYKHFKRKKKDVNFFSLCRKYKPYLEPIMPETELELGSNEIVDEKPSQKEKDIGESTESKPIVPEKKEPAQILEEKEYLLGPYLGQYVIYTDACNAWLLQ